MGVKFGFPILVLAIVLAVSLTLVIPALAEDPDTDPVASGPGEDPAIDESEIPPLPPIPTRDEYVPPAISFKDRVEQSLREAENAGETASSCPEWDDLQLDYFTEDVPTEHGGGTAEGYSGFYYGMVDGGIWCAVWVRPVAGSRITYGGEVDECSVQGKAKVTWPMQDDFFWNRSDKETPCNMNGARVIDRKHWNFQGKTWAVWGYHVFKDTNEDDKHWYESGYTYVSDNI